jgi:peptide/nickel transport system substrate-binding protein
VLGFTEAEEKNHRGKHAMRHTVRGLAAAAVTLAIAASPAVAQKRGGILKVIHRDSPPSLSIHEEATISTVAPAMPIFNNLVIYKQDVAQNSLDTIVPELAASWSWSADRTALTVTLRRGVTWHDGAPFSAKDVKCTWDLLTGRSEAKLRINPRESWYRNLESVSIDGDDRATFHLKRPQPAFLALLASGDSPVYPCHVSPAQMRTRPIGTGPFKFVEFKPNEAIKLARNPSYWKPDRPWLDGIEFTIIPNRSTEILAFIAGKFDMTFPYEVTVANLKDVKTQAPQAICEMRTTNVSANLLVNPAAPPFDNPELRRALALALDRKAFTDILSEGQAKIGGAMLPPPEGVWGMPPEVLQTIPGYGPDVGKNRDAARAIMAKLGYGPDKHLPIKISTRNIALFRDPAVILIGQLREIWVDAELEVIETANWPAKVARKQFTVGMNLTGSAVDDPDQQFYENYVCGSIRNYTGYCNADLDQLIDRQSIEPDSTRRKQLVWEIDKKLQEDGARPIMMHLIGATCWHPQVKGLTTMVNSIYNGWRLEDVWLDK